MCNFEIPQLLYYAFIPTLTISALFGLFVYISNKKSSININLALFIFIFCFWSLDSLLSWIVRIPELNLLVERLSSLEMFSLIFFLFFAHAFAKITLSWKNKILIVIPFLPILLLMFSDFNYYLVNSQTCEVQNGLLYYYLYPLAIVYTIWSIKIFLKYAKKQSNDIKVKKQVRIIIGAIFFLVSWFLLFILARFILIEMNIDWGDNLSLFLPIGMVVFIGMLTYAITQYKMFNIKLLFAQAIIIALIFFLAAELFFAESAINKILILITLLISVGLGYVLIKSVKKEIQQREALEVANKEINERKNQLQKMSDSLASANDKLRQLDQAKTDFVSLASHQLRRSPTAIKGFISLILEGSYGKMSPEIKDVLSKVYKSNDVQIEFVEDLLNISRLESGRLKFEFAASSIEELCQDTVDALAIKAKDAGLYLDYKKPKKPLPELLMDKSKIREAISNLVDNAVKYTKKGGVKLSVEVCSLRSNLCLNPKHVRITVSDTGIGIPATEMPYLFTKFSRGKDISRLDANGTGLGLYMVKMMAEGNGGKVWVESDGEGKGSRFILELPIKQSQKTLAKYA